MFCLPCLTNAVVHSTLILLFQVVRNQMLGKVGTRWMTSYVRIFVPKIIRIC